MSSMIIVQRNQPEKYRATHQRKRGRDGMMLFLTALLLLDQGAHGFQHHSSVAKGLSSTRRNHQEFRIRRRIISYPPISLQRIAVSSFSLKSQSRRGLDETATVVIKSENEKSLELRGRQRQQREQQQQVPTTMAEAFNVFFLSGDYGPCYVLLAIASSTFLRLKLLPSVSLVDGVVFLAATMFWIFQEYFLHKYILHSRIDWTGKEIHRSHHEKEYFHVSLDPAGLLMGWMLVAHLLFRCFLPSLQLAVTATIAYSISGFFYEWAHYIVHTRVRLSSKFWSQVKENHIRHHSVSDNYWFSFSLPMIDDMFQTNPDVRQVLKERTK